MAEEKAEVLSQTLSESSLKKLTLQRDVLQNKIDLFPPELKEKGRADLMFLKDGNEEILAVVTVSLQSVLTAPRLVFLQRGWKTIVEELGLRKGDKLSIFLVDRRVWAYSIQVEKAPTTEREAQANFGGHVAETHEASVTGAAEGAIADTSGSCRRAWSYSIQVEKAPTAEREGQANFGGHVVETDQTSVTGAAEGAVADTSGSCRRAWAYSIQVEKAPTAEREGEANFGGQVVETDEASVTGAAEGAIADTSGSCRRAWAYSIQVEKAPTAELEAQANFGGHVAETDEASVTGATEGAKADTSGLQLLADCAVKMEETSNRPALRPSFDLNGPPMDMEL
ncbi:hypothetical protein SLE2022_308600 [Rubroshorea leprosula]